MAKPFVHVELTTSDIGKAKSFYSALFAWKLEDREMVPGFTYTMIGVGEGTGGGMMTTPAPGVPTAWLPYVLVDDVKAATAQAKPLGATVCKDITEVPGAGSFSIIADPTGAAIGLWQPKSRFIPLPRFQRETHSAALPKGRASISAAGVVKSIRQGSALLPE